MNLRRFSPGLLVLAAFSIVVPQSAHAAEPPPTQCIKSFMIAIYSAKSLSQVDQYFCNNQRASFKSLNPAERTKKLGEFKAFYIGNAKYSDEKISGNSAHVNVTGIGYQVSIKKTASQSETFDLARENNYWRIEGARFTAKFRVN